MLLLGIAAGKKMHLCLSLCIFFSVAWTNAQRCSGRSLRRMSLEILLSRCMRTGYDWTVEAEYIDILMGISLAVEDEWI